MKRSDLQKKNPPCLQSGSIVPSPRNRADFTEPSPGLPGRARHVPAKLPSGLTNRQELWCQHFAEHGDGTAAAVAAGYGRARARNRAAENCRHPAILARVRELVQLRQSAGAPTAVNLIEMIAAGNFADPRKAAVQLKAAVVMSHVAGVGPVAKTQTEAVVEHRVELPDPNQVAASIVQLRRLLGYPEMPVIDLAPSKA